ncbi:MAG: zinc ribbon domain-containing protein [Pseudomonadota bacterium]
MTKFSLLKCECCGKNIAASTVAHGPKNNRRMMPHYGCISYSKRGATVCTKNHRVQVADLDEEIIHAITRKVLSPEAVDYVLKKALDIVTDKLRTTPNRRLKLEKQVANERKTLNQLLRLLPESEDDGFAELKQAINERRLQTQSIEQEISDLSVSLPSPLEEAMLGKINDMKRLLNSDIPLAQRALKELLYEPIVVTPQLKKGEERVELPWKKRKPEY